MENPTVKVTRLEKAPDGSSGPSVSLGDAGLSAGVTALMRRMSARASGLFLLEWEGNKIPRGAEVGGHVIAWTQNGQVLTEAGRNVGTYERLSEFGGASRKEQKMVVFLF